METSDKIIQELALSGYVVKEELIPWIDHLFHRITIEDPLNKENSLQVQEEITKVKIEHTELPYFFCSRRHLLELGLKEIKKRGWPLERRFLNE